MANILREYGKLIVPKSEYNKWLLAQLNPPSGAFVSFGESVVVGDRIETYYNLATDFQPAPPPPGIVI